VNYFRTLLPNSDSVYLKTNDVLKIWQERLLHTMLLVGALFGIVLSIYAIAPSVDSGDWTFFIGCVLLATASTFLFLYRKMSYWVRSVTALVVIYIFSNVVFFRNGWGGLSLFLLIGFSFLSTTFLYKKPTRVGLAITLVTLVVWVVLRYTNAVDTSQLNFSPYNLLIDVLLTLLVGVAGNLSIDSLRTIFLEEHIRLNSTTQKILDLESNLVAQQSDLQKRLYQLRTSSQIARTASTIMDAQALIHQVADLILDRFGLYYVGVFIIDDAREYADLKYGTGAAGKQMMADGHRLMVGGYSMVGWALQTRQPRVSMDVNQETVRFENPLLLDTRTEIALPIISGNQILGALSIQSDRDNAFDDNDMLLLQAIADSLAIALDNSATYQKNKKALEEIKSLNRAYIRDAWWNSIEENRTRVASYENPTRRNKKGEFSIKQIPLILRDEMIGVFELEFEGNDLTNEQLNLVKAIADQTALALENARLIETTQADALQEQKINEMTKTFSRALSVDEILKTAVNEFGSLPTVSEVSISLLPPEEVISETGAEE
jgi:GAF domain-containing protein